MDKNKLVLDCSVAMSWCFEDEATTYTDEILDYVSHSYAIVPSIWAIEVANVLVVAERKKRMTHAESITFVESLNLLMINVDNGLPPKPISAIQELARDSGLTAYDATYLELALRYRLPLATLDKALMRAAKKMGLALYT